MKRREFLRVIAGSAAVSAIAPSYGFSDKKFTNKGLLIEACAFEQLGGWVLDTQFYHQMGGNQLLAHGMGIPVANAQTPVNVPDAGQWHVFVRTRDWCPGNWPAPGQFKVLVDGQALPSTLGTEKGWAWQKAGVIELSKGKHQLAVQDLTGFDGRFDAIYLSQDAAPILPNSTKAIMDWKDQMSGRSALTIVEKQFDVVIAGGGISGCAAALAAVSQGLKVALVQDRPVFGGNASAEIRVHTLGIYGKGEKILKSIDTAHYENGDAEALIDQEKREKTMAESGVALFPSHLLIGLERQDSSILSVEARHTSSGIITRFRAPQFIDCTGDAWLGYWAGAKYRIGREAHSEFGELWQKHGDLWSPEKADNRVMGTSVLWNSERGTSPSRFPEVPWALPVVKGDAAINGAWDWEYSANELDQIEDAEQIRDHLFRALFGNFYNAKKHPRNALVKLKFVAFIGGRRESRRLEGDYIYSMKDATENRQFDDTVVEETRALDSHFQLKEHGHKADYRSEAIFRKVPRYYMPFRCFYSKNISNLMMAGRSFSCTHIGLAGPRVMNTCGQMGIATGYAAALCKKHGVNPRTVGQKHLQELKALVGYA